MAAAYLGISERTFEKQWRAESLPQPIRFGRRLLWDRKRLDQWADEVSGIHAVEDPFADL
jgi:predicted DNA-binding transcriptional regulator AlpA